jgi:hypothetical protein
MGDEPPRPLPVARPWPAIRTDHVTVFAQYSCAAPAGSRSQRSAKRWRRSGHRHVGPGSQSRPTATGSVLRRNATDVPGWDRAARAMSRPGGRRGHGATASGRGLPLPSWRAAPPGERPMIGRRAVSRGLSRRPVRAIRSPRWGSDAAALALPTPWRDGNGVDFRAEVPRAVARPAQEDWASLRRRWRITAANAWRLLVP